MATPKELVAAVARETGVPMNTVIQHDRNLSLAGLRTVAGRGRAAATVTYSDAANLLIAVAASRNVKDSAATAKLYGTMISSTPLVLEDAGTEIPWGVTFHEALAGLLEAVPMDSGRFGGPEGDTISVSLFGPYPRASIAIKQHERDKPLMAKYELADKSHASIQSMADLHYITRFSQVTLGLVGQIVAG